jgi:3-hydroxyacyl-[acyl-carrier-protein] dehydratase
MFPAVTDLIPHRAPFLFVDEIVSETPERLVARRLWRPEEDFYRGHYPGSPITPGVLLCEATLQTAALFIARRQAGSGGPSGVPLVAKMTDVRFRQPVLPGDTTVTEIKLKETIAGFVLMSGCMKVGDKRVMTLEVSLAWKAVGGGPAP